MLAITPNPAVNALVAQRAREEFLVATVQAMLKPDSDGGLFDVLASVGAAPLCGAPFDFGRWDAVAERADAPWVEVAGGAGAAAELGEVDPDVGAFALLPVFVRRGAVLRLFSDANHLLEGDRVLAIRDPDA